MLYTEEYVEIGRIRKSYGYVGHARIDIADAYYEDYLRASFIFLEVDGCKVPFAITERIENKHLMVKLEFLDSPDDILPYHQAPILLLKRDIHVPSTPQSDAKSPLIGMTIYDIHMGMIGEIIRVEEYPQQLMSFIVVEDREVMIPLHDSLIDSIDESLGIVTMDLPEGLLEL